MGNFVSIPRERKKSDRKADEKKDRKERGRQKSEWCRNRRNTIISPLHRLLGVGQTFLKPYCPHTGVFEKCWMNSKQSTLTKNKLLPLDTAFLGFTPITPTGFLNIKSKY